MAQEHSNRGAPHPSTLRVSFPRDPAFAEVLPLVENILKTACIPGSQLKPIEADGDTLVIERPFLDFREPKRVIVPFRGETVAPPSQETVSALILAAMAEREPSYVRLWSHDGKSELDPYDFASMFEPRDITLKLYGIRRKAELSRACALGSWFF